MKPLQFNPTAGSHIDNAITRALDLASQCNRPVRFRFNGMRLTVNKRLSHRHLLGQWEHSFAASQLAYRRSKRGRDDAAKHAANIARHQATVTALSAALPTVASLDGMMAWLNGFTPAADYCGVTFDHHALASEMEKMGFIENEGVGNGVPSTAEAMGRYIVGQAITCLRAGMGPHPITTTFIGKYLALKRQEGLTK
jgi:hypothetical protein